VNNDDYLLAADIYKKGTEAAKIFWGLLNPSCQELDALHDKAVARRDSVCNPYKEGAKTAKGKMLSYEQAEETKRQIAQAKADAEAKEKADAEALELATELEKAGLKEDAAAVIENPPEPQQVVLAKFTPKVDGFRSRTIWSFEVTNLDLVPDEYKYVVVDEKKIKAVVDRLKGATNIAGIRVTERRV
jgi:hypothetical protein